MPDFPPGAQPVAGPGGFSARTDQAPGQPVRVPTGLPYGKEKQLEQAERAVPLPAASATGSVSPGAAGPAQPAPVPSPEPRMDSTSLLQMLSHQRVPTHEPIAPPARFSTPSEMLPATLSQMASAPNATDDVKQLAAYVASGRR